MLTDPKELTNEEGGRVMLGERENNVLKSSDSKRGPIWLEEQR